MAEFSKQWIEENGDDMIPDFDILEIAKDLLPNTGFSIICEGYGFIGIGKDEFNNVILAMPASNKEIEWVEYNTIVK
jgi:hypothetical protein